MGWAAGRKPPSCGQPGGGRADRAARDAPADADMRRVELNAAMGRDPPPSGALDDTSRAPRAALAGAARSRRRHASRAARGALESRKPTRAPASRRPRKARLGLAGRLHVDAGQAGAWTARVGVTGPGAVGEEACLRVTAEADALAQAARSDLETSRQRIARMIAEARVTLVGTLASSPSSATRAPAVRAHRRGQPSGVRHRPAAALGGARRPAHAARNRSADRAPVRSGRRGVGGARSSRRRRPPRSGRGSVPGESG